MALEVYLDPCTINSRKVLAGLDLMGVKYNLNFVDFFAGQQRSPDYLKINPNGTVPAAVDGDLIITESNAILQYGADLVDSEYYSKDLKTRAEINRWLFWESSVWFQSCYVYIVEFIVKPLLKASPDYETIDKEAPNWHKWAGILESRLAKTGKFLAGELSIADLSVAASMHLHAAQKLPLDNYPNLQRWMRDIESLPVWKKTQPAVEKALLPNKSESDGATQTSSEGVKGKFNYTKDVAPKLTELYFYESPDAADIHEPGDDPHEMTVKDGWHRSQEFSIDKEGFAVLPFLSSYDDWENDPAVTKDFYPEIVELLKQKLSAKRVLVFDHTIRTENNSQKKITQETNTSQRAPVMLVHCDYTAESGPTRVRQLLKEEADDLLSRRVAFINVWKPIRRTVEERPLAMCDVTSAPSEDFFKLHLRYRDRNGENYVMKHSDKHQWWYFPNMSPQQVILLKTFDSETDGRARFVGHSAFEDPTSRPDAPFRESVEIRTICFF